MLHSTCQQSWKIQQWPQANLKKAVYIPIQKKSNAKECSNYRNEETFERNKEITDVNRSKLHQISRPVVQITLDLNANYTSSQDLWCHTLSSGPTGATLPLPGLCLLWGQEPCLPLHSGLPSHCSSLIPSHLSPFQTMKALFLLVKDFPNPWSSMQYSGIQAIKQELSSSNISWTISSFFLAYAKMIDQIHKLPA